MGAAAPEDPGASDVAVATVAFGGDLDLIVAPAITRRLLRAANGVSVVQMDLGAVTFFDSSAVHATLDAYRSLGQMGVRLVVTNPPPLVCRVLEITGALDLLTG
jgi:anti-anti-sigma factor